MVHEWGIDYVLSRVVRQLAPPPHGKDVGEVASELLEHPLYICLVVVDYPVVVVVVGGVPHVDDVAVDGLIGRSVPEKLHVRERLRRCLVAVLERNPSSQVAGGVLVFCTRKKTEKKNKESKYIRSGR